jgi:hypothetical protein
VLTEGTGMEDKFIVRAVQSVFVGIVAFAIAIVVPMSISHHVQGQVTTQQIVACGKLAPAAQGQCIQNVTGP